jgi:hypothetical protein
MLLIRCPARFMVTYPCCFLKECVIASHSLRGSVVGQDRRATWTCQGPSCWLRAIIIITLSVATGCTALHRHCSTYSEHPWTRYLPRFTMLSRTSSIMLRIYYPSSLAACASHNPGSKSTVECVRTRSFTYLERNLNRFTSQDRESLGRRWILFRIPCARRG